MSFIINSLRFVLLCLINFETLAKFMSNSVRRFPFKPLLLQNYMVEWIQWGLM